MVIDNRENVAIIQGDSELCVTYRSDGYFERNVIFTVVNNEDKNVSIIRGSIDFNDDSTQYESIFDNGIDVPFNIPANTSIKINVVFHHRISKEDNKILNTQLTDGEKYYAKELREYFDEHDIKHRAFCELWNNVLIQLETSKKTLLNYEFSFG